MVSGILRLEVFRFRFFVLQGISLNQISPPLIRIWFPIGILFPIRVGLVFQSGLSNL